MSDSTDAMNWRAQIKNDHDLITKLANDMMWIKRILFATFVPVLLASVKFLVAGAPG